MTRRCSGATTIPSRTYEALKERIPGIQYVRGCGLISNEFMPKPDPNNPLEKARNMTGAELEAVAKQFAIGVQDIQNYIRRQDERQKDFLPALDVEAVLESLKDIDIVIFAGGISPRLEGEEMPVQLPGFKGGDRTDISRRRRPATPSSRPGIRARRAVWPSRTSSSATWPLPASSPSPSTAASMTCPISRTTT